MLRFVVLFFTFTFFQTQAEESMRDFNALTEFENFYEQMHPSKENDKEAFVWLTGVPNPLLNAVMHLSTEDVAEKVDALLQEYSQEVPLSFWVHPQNQAESYVEILKERGFKSIITCPLMVCQIQAMIPMESDIRSDDMSVFYDLASTVYEFDEEVKRGFQKLMENTNCENYVIYDEKKPVGTVSLCVNGEFGGVFNDATLPGRREASVALMQFLMKRAEDLKLKSLIVLSSPEGEELYSSLGFKKVFDVELYSR